MIFQKMTIKNTYEAAFYMLHGARLVGAYERRIPLKKAKKAGYQIQWYMEMENVPLKQIQNHKERTAQVKLHEFEDARKLLKKKVRKILESKYDQQID